MPVIFKPIKPAKFKEKAFADSVKRRGEVVKQGILKDYQAGVATWNYKPAFDAQVIANPNGGVSITVDTSDEVYLWVHDGTRPHLIRAKRKRLKFRGKYKAKTSPGVIKSGSGGASGPSVYRQVVRHPGTKARNFTKLIFAKWRPLFEREMNRALQEGAKDSGHGA